MRTLTTAGILVLLASPALGQTNIANVTQPEAANDNEVDISQEGYWQEAYVIQTDDRNSTEIEQVNLFDLSGGPNYPALALVHTTVDQGGHDNTAYISQEFVPGTGPNHGPLFALVDQSGDRNRALQYQGPSTGAFGDMRAEVDQSGDDNAVIQLQPSSSGHAAYAHQSGSRNRAEQEQRGQNGFADVVQTDDDNLAYQVQAGSGATAYVLQSGAVNFSEQDQYGLDNHARVEQSGNENAVSQVQAGRRNESRSLQDGDRNAASQDQSSPMGHTSLDYFVNRARISQSGQDNTAGQIQSVISPATTGPPNWAEILQPGNQNTALQSQFDVGHSSVIIQGGERNTATICQTSGVEGCGV